MTVHLIKMAVRVENTKHLAEIQQRRLAQDPDKGLRHLTRNTPRRSEELLDGGSIYWVMGGLVRARQRVLGIERVTGREGQPRCALRLDPELVRVEPRARGPFQGWRYLEPRDAPPDLPDTGSNDDLPADMARQLRDLGLL